jgi:hypothetical protein
MNAICSIIRDALGLTRRAGIGGDSQSKVNRNVILDAEMVAFSDRLNMVDGAHSSLRNLYLTVIFNSRILENTRSHY